MRPPEQLIQVATDLLKKYGFDVLSPGAERHGTWEWAWAQAHGKGHAYVTLGALEESPGIYRLEAWAAADDGSGYGRELVATVKDVKAASWDTTSADLVEIIEQAVAAALKLSDSKLPNPYPPRVRAR